MSEAREIAEHQLEMALKDSLLDELEACWNRLKDDASIDDPAEQMSELAEWFQEQIETAIADIIENDPVDAEDDDIDDYEDDEEDDGDEEADTEQDDEED